MYQILYTNTFKKNLRKIIKSGNFPRERVEAIIDMISGGAKLEPSLNNHKLHGKYDGTYECHIRPDMLLIYKKDNEEKVITLLDIGSHSDLF